MSTIIFVFNLIIQFHISRTSLYENLFFIALRPLTAILSCAPYGRSARRFYLLQENYLRFNIISYNRYWFDA